MALRPSWLFDGESLRPEPTILLDGPVVTAVSYGEPPPAGTTVVELPGATVLPGLVDTHVHLAFDASVDPVVTLAARSDDEVLAAMTKCARTAVRGGVTTVRDLGDRGYLSLRLRGSGAADLPTVVAAGPPITTPGGHCHFLGGVAEPGPDGIRAAVREHAARGVDVVKIMASGGTMTPGTHQELSQFTPEELRAAVDEAHAHSLPVTAHAHGTAAIREAIAAGVDGLEHATFWTADGVDEPPPDIVRSLVESRIVVGLTGGMAPVPGAAPPEEILKRIPSIFANAALLYRAGARLVVGTDAGIAPVKPPDVLRYALQWMQDTGWSPAGALRAVTADAADAIGLGDRKGRIAAGYDADLLVVDGDPLADPETLHSIRAVYARGVPVTGPRRPEPAGGRLPPSPG